MGMRVEVVLAVPQRKERVMLDLSADCTVLDAVRMSGLLARFPLGKTSHLGIWGKLAPPDKRLRERDRVEIYRPLLADPKEVRRGRAAKTALRKQPTT